MVVWRRTRSTGTKQCGDELALLYLLFRIIHFVPMRELSRKGGHPTVPKVAREDLGLGGHKKLDEKRDQPGKVFSLGRILVVGGQLLEVLPSI